MNEKMPFNFKLEDMEHCQGDESYEIKNKYWTYSIHDTGNGGDYFLYEGTITKHIGKHFESILFEERFSLKNLVKEMNDWINARIKEYEERR